MNYIPNTTDSAMSEQMTQEELLTHISEMERALLGGARFQTILDYRLLGDATRHIHSNTLIQQIAYHTLLVDQLQLRFPQHQPQEPQE